MLRNISQTALIFTAMFFLLTLTIKPFQLMGITDQGYWINFFYNVINLGEPVSSLNKTTNILEYSLLILISPLAYIKNPIALSYVLYYLTYLSWFLTFYLLYFGQFEIKKVYQSFLLFFCSTTLFFHYGMNFNGWNSIYIAPALMALSYYFSFIKANYKKSILLFLPLLFLKLQFWLLLPFLLLSIYIHSKNKQYLLYAFLSLIVFFFYLKIRPLLYDESFTGYLLESAYSHLNINDIKNFIQIFLDNIGLKLTLMLAFFVQFIFLIDLKAIKKNDLFIYFLLIFPIFSYCILSSRTVMSYWTHEHYVLPVIPVILLILLKYSSLSKIRIFLFVITNLILICGIFSLKEPWQYKYYQDESQLENKIKTLMTLNYDDHILADDRTGLYFSNHQINFLKFINDKTRHPKYIVLNLRYIFYINNLKRQQSKEVISSFEFVEDYEKNLNEYGILYYNYPFIVYENKLISNVEIDSEVMNDWDQMSIQNNKVF
tara:strand:+ start:498 stop:1961 length:1464 start_codon:yes stop_codon:yes gene_type:complete